MVSSKQKTITIDGETLSLAKAYEIAYGTKICLSKASQKKVKANKTLLDTLFSEEQPIYGVNTGFGFLANEVISHQDLQSLQYNLLKSHAAGHGKPLSIEETRLAMVLRLNVLVKGLAGVRWKLCQALENLIAKEIYPLIPEYGSVGASGDLAPLAHLALPLIGAGSVVYKGKVLPAKKALQHAGLTPLQLEKKEGIALINGTQIMLAIGSLALIDAIETIRLADKIAAMTFEGFQGQPKALDPYIHQQRGHPGQIQSAKRISLELTGSSLWNKPLDKNRVQDPYSLRCAPQIHGPSSEAIEYSKNIIERELNAATDNPLVISKEKGILSGGNFHGQPLAMAFDFAAIALSEIANVADRRLELLMNPHMSGLPAFLSPSPGAHNGYMALQYLSASLVNENKLLANPACTDSIPGNAGIEDHVSMGMTAAKKLKKVVKNVQTVLAIELLAASQAIDLQENKKLGKGTKKSYKMLRSKIPFLEEDRIIAEDIAFAVEVIKRL